MMRTIHTYMHAWRFGKWNHHAGGGGDSILDGCLQRRCTIFLTDVGRERERERESRFHIYATHSAPRPPIYLSIYPTPAKPANPPTTRTTTGTLVNPTMTVPNSDMLRLLSAAARGSRTSSNAVAIALPLVPMVTPRVT